MKSEAASHADFSQIRYAQCWEDADILVEALDIREGYTCLSIASAGDNALAMLARGAERVIALDLNPSQLHCLALRVAAYKELSHEQLLQLMGSSPCADRPSLYARCRPLLDADARAFWDAHPDAIANGIGGAGKFERYFALFRNRVLPLIHSHKKFDRLLERKNAEQRISFYEDEWNTLRWRLLFRIFFSRFLLGRLGRDPSFFRYVEGSVADKILERTRHALRELEPADNPYLQWILTGEHRGALPYALREGAFEAIRSNIDKIEWRQQSIEEFIKEAGSNTIDAFNLSDIFEYMSEENTAELLELLADAGKPGARLAYWNTLAPRSRPESLADRLKPLPELSRRLHLQDKAFFYCAFVVEEVIG